MQWHCNGPNFIDIKLNSFYLHLICFWMFMEHIFLCPINFNCIILMFQWITLLVTKTQPNQYLAKSSIKQSDPHCLFTRSRPQGIFDCIFWCWCPIKGSRLALRVWPGRPLTVEKLHYTGWRSRTSQRLGSVKFLSFWRLCMAFRD